MHTLHVLTAACPQDDDSDMNSMSDSDDELQSSINRAPGPLPENLYFNKLGKKLKDFQDLRYPSRSLDPNPDKYSRQKPFPELFDVKLTHSYNRFCKKAGNYRYFAVPNKRGGAYSRFGFLLSKLIGHPVPCLSFQN